MSHLHRVLLRTGSRTLGHYWPLAKIFSPVDSAIWLIAPMDPQDEDTLYGLCSLRLGFPEPGCARLSELQSMTVRMQTAGLGLEPDMYF